MADIPKGWRIEPQNGRVRLDRFQTRDAQEIPVVGHSFTPDEARAFAERFQWAAWEAERDKEGAA